MSTARLIGTGVVVLAAGAVGALLPIDEEFSDFGLGRSGRVTLDCGNAFSDGVTIRGDAGISVFDPVFVDGDNGDESATQFCDRKRAANRLIAIVGLAVGALLFLVGLFWPNPHPRRRPDASCRLRSTALQPADTRTRVRLSEMNRFAAVRRSHRCSAPSSTPSR